MTAFLAAAICRGRAGGLGTAVLRRLSRTVCSFRHWKGGDKHKGKAVTSGGDKWR